MRVCPRRFTSPSTSNAAGRCAGTPFCGRAGDPPAAPQYGERRGRIPEMVMISERPAEAADRAVPGHWEGDLIMALPQVRDRDPGRTVDPVRDAAAPAPRIRAGRRRRRHAAPMAGPAGGAAPVADLGPGHEMAGHAQIAAATDCQIYFCDPHSPWQRGSNENTNGLLRQYFPKGTDLSAAAASGWPGRRRAELPSPQDAGLADPGRGAGRSSWTASRLSGQARTRRRPGGRRSPPEGCRAWLRGRPSGLKAAAHRAARGGPAAGPDPGDLCGPWAAGTKGQAKACPGPRAAPRHRPATGMVNTERVIYRHRCNDPLNPSCGIHMKSEITVDQTAACAWAPRAGPRIGPTATTHHLSSRAKSAALSRRP